MVVKRDAVTLEGLDPDNDGIRSFDVVGDGIFDVPLWIEPAPSVKVRGVTVRNLQLSGGLAGLWIAEGSVSVILENLKIFDNSSVAFTIRGVPQVIAEDIEIRGGFFGLTLVSQAVLICTNCHLREHAIALRSLGGFVNLVGGSVTESATGLQSLEAGNLDIVDTQA